MNTQTIAPNPTQTPSTTKKKITLWLVIGLASLLASGLPAAVLDPGWTATISLAGTGVLLLLYASSFSLTQWAQTRPILLIFALISTLGWLSSLLAMVFPSLVTTVPVPLAFLAINGIKLIPLALAIVVARRYYWTSSELYLRIGEWRTGGWLILGPLVCLLVAGLFFSGLPADAWSQLPSALPWLPVMLAGCLINASAEEFLYRSAALRALGTVMSLRWALLVSSLVFGIGHLDGNPGGWVGAFGATLFGLVCALAMIRTRGSLWNLIIHVCADLSIVFCLTLMQPLA